MTAFTGFPRDGYAFSAAEVGLALSGLVAREVSGVPRVGMLGRGPAVAAVAAAWKVQVGRFVYVHQVGGAVQFSGLSAAEQVDIVPAVGMLAGQSRIDVVCWDPASAVLSVVTGTAAVSPVSPSVGALAEVARVLVLSTDGMVIAGRVTPVYALSALSSADGDTGWVSPPVSEGTGRAGDVPRVQLVNGVVYFAGSSKPAAGVEKLQFVLPEGMRPDANFSVYLTTDSPGRARVTVGANGNVRFNEGDGGYIYFAGLPPFVAKTV